MMHLKNIQEAIDEHKQDIPDGVVVELCKKLQELHTALDDYYYITMITTEAVYSVHLPDDDEPFADVQLITKKRKSLVKAIDNEHEPEELKDKCAYHFLDYGYIHKNWLNLELPYIMQNPHNNSRQLIITSIEKKID